MLEDGELKLISLHSGIYDKEKTFISFCRYFKDYRIDYSVELSDEELFECLKDKFKTKKEERK